MLEEKKVVGQDRKGRMWDRRQGVGQKRKALDRRGRWWDRKKRE